MTQQQITAFPDGKVFHTCTTLSQALVGTEDINGTPIQQESVATMFVFKKGGRGDDWAVYAQTLHTLYTKWDYVYETMVDATRDHGVKIKDFNIIKQLLPLDEECFKTYRL